jgi:hypothetical protein
MAGARGGVGRRSRGLAIALFAALGLLFAASARPASAEDGASCGTPGLPPCPLQAWMRQRIAGPLASNELEKLARGLDAAAELSPDRAWTEWRRFASDAAAAARRGDVASARRACRSCHAKYRAEYRARYRERALPAR